MNFQNQWMERFGTSSGEISFYFAPGRINLIGEHTDYNGGFVLPGSIDKGIAIAIAPNGTDQISVFSKDFDEHCQFGRNEADLPSPVWAKYIFGVVRELQKRGKTIPGFNSYVTGNIPLGAGLSSSAALESVYAFALNDLFGLEMDKLELAKIGQATEHHYVGVKCGIMDQFASIFGKAGYLMCLDCRSLEYEYIPFHPAGYKLVLVDSVVKHELTGSPYNRRRESCERVVAAIRKRHPEVEFLRDASAEMLLEIKPDLTDEDFRRADYVIGEIQRLLHVCEALKRDDFETVGRNMYETHQGLSKLYEVSCDELDYLIDLAKACGVSGARVMGGGFGGCTLNLVKENRYDNFIQEVKKQYPAKFGVAPQIYEVIIGDGARKIPE